MLEVILLFGRAYLATIGGKTNQLISCPWPNYINENDFNPKIFYMALNQPQDVHYLVRSNENIESGYGMVTLMSTTHFWLTLEILLI